MEESKCSVKIGFLISGNGSYLRNFIESVRDNHINAEIAIVISNNKISNELKAEIIGNDIAYAYIPQKSLSVKHYNKLIIDELKEHNVNLVVLGGFLSILGWTFVQAFKNKIINVHPSLIPNFCGKGFFGKNVHKEVIDSGVKISGATVHFVDSGINTGGIILQKALSLSPTETVKSLSNKIRMIEHELLPKAVEMYCDGKVKASSGAKKSLRIINSASTLLPTKFGQFLVHAFHMTDGKEHLAISLGNLEGEESLPLRIHSECFTSEVLSSLKCDCKSQLDKSLAFLQKKKRGIVIYLRQEGRDIGLVNKIAAYNIQTTGVDTVEANKMLGFPDELREYEAAIKIISLLKIKSVELLSNNPDKFEKLRKGGIKIVKRLPILGDILVDNVAYLKAKQKYMRHLYNIDDNLKYL